MARQIRKKSGTGIYHVMLRGINRQDIFEDDDDYLQMTSILRGQSERYDEQGLRLSPFCTFYAYCLMSNLEVNKMITRTDPVIPPRWGVSFGLAWARHSYIRHKEKADVYYLGEDKEHLVLFARQYIQEHPNIDYFIFGHRHIELDIRLARPAEATGHKARMMILGDWISQFTYALYDGEHMFLEEYVEGESLP